MLEGLVVSMLVFIALAVLSLIGAWYANEFDRADALIGIYVLFLTCAQFFAAKIAAYDFGLITFIAPTGIIVFPFTLQLTDMVNEKFGRRKVYEMILIAFMTQVAMVFFLMIAEIPPAVHGGDPLEAFAIVPRITIASWIAFLISENVDAWLYDKIRTWVDQRYSKVWWKVLWIRNVFSDVISLGLDSLIFTPLAFLGIVPTDVLLSMIVGQLATKWILGVIDTPFMYLTRFIYQNEVLVE